MAQSQKEQLVQELDAQRSHLDGRFQSLKAGLEPGHQLRLSLRKHPLRWTLGAATSAFLGTRLLRRRKSDSRKSKKRGGLLFQGAKLAFFFARPALTTFALQKAREQLEKHLNRTPDNSMLGGSPQK